MHLREKICYGAALWLITLSLRAMPMRLRKKAITVLMFIVGTYPRFPTTKVAGKYSTILDVFSRIDPFSKKMTSDK